MKMLSYSLHCYNHFGMDYGRQIADIVDAAHKNDVVQIHTAGEPFDFDQIEWKGTKFLDILRNICKENNWPLEKFCIFSNNLLQSDATWPKIKKQIYIKPFLYGSSIKKEAKKLSQNILVFSLITVHGPDCG